jgi:hypothetical protein
MKISQLVSTPKKFLRTGFAFIRPTIRNVVSSLFTWSRDTHSKKEKYTTTLPAVVTKGEELAHHIMGDDFLIPEEVSRVYGCSYSEDQRTALALTVPCARTLLELNAKGYMLAATLPIECNLHGFREIMHQPHYKEEEGWCLRQPQRFFYQDVLKPCRWIAIRKEPYRGSRRKTWAFQQGFLNKDEYIPNAIEVVYAITTYHMVRGVCLLYRTYVRTSSVDEDSRHVIVGGNSSDGVCVREFMDDEPEDYVGVLSARTKVENLSLDFSFLQKL